MRIAFIALVLSWASVAQANEGQIAESLALWDPVSVEVSNGIATITTREQRVTEQIYTSVISLGICFGLLSNPESLAGIQEIRVLNSFGRQGYVFEGGKEECETLNNTPGREKQLQILAVTHMHMN